MECCFRRTHLPELRVLYPADHDGAAQEVGCLDPPPSKNKIQQQTATVLAGTSAVLVRTERERERAPKPTREETTMRVQRPQRGKTRRMAALDHHLLHRWSGIASGLLFLHLHFLFLVPSWTAAAPLEDLVVSLPDLDPDAPPLKLPTPHFSGFLDATKGCDTTRNGAYCKIHYWLALAEGPDPWTKPVVLWLNGAFVGVAVCCVALRG